MINYKLGNLFDLLPYASPAPIFIPHVCNNIYKFGSGFVVPLSKKWPETRQAYLALPNLKLGEVQFVKVADNIFVCNMISQNRVISAENPKPIKYAALVECMQRVAEACRILSCAKSAPEIWAPCFGSGLAGGTWTFIEELINEIWGEFEVNICKLEE